MGFADLHIHTVHSHDGTASVPAILKHVADHTELKVIAVTDHDKTAGVKEAVLLAPRYGLEVIPGCEVSTTDGHLLALFITHPIPAGLSLAETVKRVGRQGGLCIAPHPEARGTSSLSGQAIREALADPDLAKILVGIEIFNGGLVYTRSNQVAAQIGQTLDVARVGNSDSHILQTIGQGSTEFDGSTAADLRRALAAHATVAHVGQGLQGAQALKYWLPKFVLRKLGWVAWNADPEAPLRYARMKRILNPTLADPPASM